MSKRRLQSQSSVLNSPFSIFLVVLLLLAMYAQMTGSIRVKSATYDEQEYLARGYAVLQTGDMRLRLRHPLLTNLISAAPLLLIPDLEVPTGHPSWANAEFHAFSAEFLWGVNREHADQIVYLSRWPMMLLTLVLAAFVYRWAKELFGHSGGLLALALTAFDPNLIAHGRLANTDIGSVAFIFIAAYAFWKYLHKPNWRRLILAGIACGLAQTTRFTALLLFPIFGLQALVAAWQEEGRLRWRVLERTTLVVAALLGISLLVIWAVYGFTWGPVDGTGPSLPAPDHWGEFLSLIQRLDRSDPAFLLGRIYEGGWWPYFFVALTVKTPLPTLILIGWATVRMFHRRQWLRDISLLLPVAAYFGTAVMGNLNIGYRLILPILPFLAVHVGRLVELPMQRRMNRFHLHQLLPIVFCTWLAVSALVIYPHYLAYFNELIGPSNGYKVLVDSNLDWGQDLPGLRDWMDERSVEEVYLSWFGIAPPEHYGVRYRYLPGWPPFEDPALRIYHPQRPLPGTYAISATNLQGVLLDAHDTFDYFQEREPIGQVGHSILLYEVAAQGSPAALALGGIRFDQLSASVLDENFETNDLRLRWFDPEESIVLMPHSESQSYCYAVPGERSFHSALASRFLSKSTPLTTGESKLYPCISDLRMRQRLTKATRSGVSYGSGERHSVDYPVSFSEQIALLGYESWLSSGSAGGELSVLTYWKVLERPEHSLRVFIHVVNEKNDIITQEDRLDVPTAGWYEGDIIAQLHTMPIPSGGDLGAYQVELGLYDPQTMERLEVLDNQGKSVATRLWLECLERANIGMTRSIQR